MKTDSKRRRTRHSVVAVRADMYEQTDQFCRLSLHSGFREVLYNALYWYWHWVSFQIRSDIGNQLTTTVMIMEFAGAEYKRAYRLWYCIAMVGRDEVQFVYSLHNKFTLRPKRSWGLLNWLEWSAICDDAFADFSDVCSFLILC
jgi:hypothetical protein